MTDNIHSFFEWVEQLMEKIVLKLYPVASTDNTITEIPLAPPDLPQNSPVEALKPPIPTVITFDFSTPQKAFKSVREICDNAGLPYSSKNIICACLYQESEFYNTAKNENKNTAGKVLSTDWGICQVNDYYHIGIGKDFPNVQYVLDNPDKVVEWMIGMYNHGLLKQWVSYSSGAYLQWLPLNSAMWKLDVDNSPQT